MNASVCIRGLKPGDRVKFTWGGLAEYIITDLTPGDIHTANEYVATGGKVLICVSDGTHLLTTGDTLVYMLEEY